MCISALIAGGAALIGSSQQSRAAGRAVDAQTDAANAQIASNERIYGQQEQAFAPYRQAGTNFLSAYMGEMGRSGDPSGAYDDIYGTGPFQASGAYDDIYGTGPYEQSDRYRFLQRQAQRGIDGSAAAQGNLFSSRTLDRQQENAFGLAAQDYGNWQQGQAQRVAFDTNELNNWRLGQERRVAFDTDERSNYLNRLMGGVSMGQASAAMQATASGNLGAQNNQALANIGNAQATGSIAQGNAWNQGIGNALSAYNYMNTTNPGASGGFGWG